MPIHLSDLDVVSEAAGVSSALIVPCNLCPAVTVAVNKKQPFMRLFKSLVKSAPFEQYIKDLQTRLGEKGVKTTVFRSNIYHQWFLCMWTDRRRMKLQKAAKDHEAVIVLGCDTANETVRDAVESTGARVIEGMQVEHPVAGEYLLQRLQDHSHLSEEEFRNGGLPCHRLRRFEWTRCEAVDGGSPVQIGFLMGAKERGYES